MSEKADILNGKRYRVECSDCLPWLRALPDNCIDLIVCSPPYEAARTYGIDFKLRGQEWVDWAVERFVECVRVCKGLVVWVVEGQTRQFRWSATPSLMIADLHRANIHLRKPPIFNRVGICGSGGPDYWRNDYEFCVIGSKGGKLAWSNNTATGKPCRFGVGGAMSNRTADGRRRNARTGKRVASGMVAKANGKLHTKNDGEKMRVQCYRAPELANPGNVIRCKVGGGRMGSKLAHENEASFPESLVEPFVLCFCPPDGITCDIFSGSGTTAAVALKCNRRFIGCDVRQSQVDLTLRRISEYQRELIA